MHGMLTAYSTNLPTWSRRGTIRSCVMPWSSSLSSVKLRDATPPRLTPDCLWRGTVCARLKPFWAVLRGGEERGWLRQC